MYLNFLHPLFDGQESVKVRKNDFTRSKIPDLDERETKAILKEEKGEVGMDTDYDGAGGGSNPAATK